MYTKEHVTKHKLLLESIHEFQVAGILGFRATQRRSSGENRRGQAGQRSQDKDTHRKRKLASTDSSSVHPVFQPNFSISSFFAEREPITLFLDFQASTHHDSHLNADLLLLHQPFTRSLHAGSLLLPTASVADACDAELRSCCVFFYYVILCFFFVTQSHPSNCFAGRL